MLGQLRQRQIARDAERRLVDRIPAVQERVRNARALQVRIVCAETEAAEEARQEIVDLLIADLEPANLAGSAEVLRTADEYRLGDAVARDVERRGVVEDVVLDPLREDVEGQRAYVASSEIPFQRRVEIG